MPTRTQLESYLAWAIHGRRPPRRATSPTRKGPPRDAEYKAWVRSLPCAACGIEGRSEAAHTGEDGGMSMKASDYSCMPLCLDCHTQAPGAYHRIGKRAFVSHEDVGPITREVWLKIREPDFRRWAPPAS